MDEEPGQGSQDTSTLKEIGSRSAHGWSSWWSEFGLNESPRRGWTRTRQVQVSRSSQHFKLHHFHPQKAAEHHHLDSVIINEGKRARMFLMRVSDWPLHTHQRVSTHPNQPVRLHVGTLSQTGRRVSGTVSFLQQNWGQNIQNWC